MTTAAPSARSAYVLTILTGSFLLFLVQPLMGRIVLPVLGGSPNVWNIAMLFYQGVLLAGYLYAHGLQRLPVRRQLVIHLALFAIAALFLPIGMAAWYPPAGATDPALWLIGLLAASIGPVFFVVSAQAPLMQAWFARTGDPDAGNPYFLYAASNLGSFGALIAYPLLVEPLAGLPAQRWGWSAGLVVLAGLVLACGLLARGVSTAQPSVAAPYPTSWRERLRWAGLAAVASGLLLSTTTHLTTDLMAMPLLWVVPLAIYLLSFVIGFSDAGPRVTALAVRMSPWLLLLVGGPLFLAGKGPGVSVALALAGLILLLVITLALHGTLALERPPAAGLTSFYLWLSVGGAVGGLFCALLAPMLFSWPWEHPLLLLLAAALLPLPGPGWLRRWGVLLLLGLLMAGLGGADRLRAVLAGQHTRSFFGVYSVRDTGGLRFLRHGTTLHGVQSLSPRLAREPMTYYVPGSGVGLAMKAAPRLFGPAARIGVVGLGAGTLACYAQGPQRWSLYEIDPAVVAIARRDFTYLKNCTPTARMVVGDARLTLQAEAPASLDLLAVDAFSSDSIPLHMMTREAMAVYGRVLAPDGLLLIHISNRFLDLEPVVAALAGAGGWQARMLHYESLEPPQAGVVRARSLWVALSRDPARLASLTAAGGGWRPLRADPGLPVWSDDFASLLPVLRWRRD
ncbi:MAG: fused MFS/spermidine synthase [Alphaproteobacteria bacterium]|nr:fused MFS/spermidine synthase [Alphaproteobacteria bacterium]